MVAYETTMIKCHFSHHSNGSRLHDKYYAIRNILNSAKGIFPVETIKLCVLTSHIRSITQAKEEQWKIILYSYIKKCLSSVNVNRSNRCEATRIKPFQCFCFGLQWIQQCREKRNIKITVWVALYRLKHTKPIISNEFHIQFYSFCCCCHCRG